MGNPINIFVSYAHVDRLKNELNPTGWVGTFLDFLTPELSAGVGRVEYMDVWVDRDDLKSNEPTDEQIEKAIDNSAIFLMIASNSYLESTYCMGKELPRFMQKQHRNRIFVVERTPVDATRFPEFYRDLPAIRLWTGNPAKKWRPLNPKVMDDDKGEYYVSVWNLICDLTLLIKELRTTKPLPPPIVPNVPLVSARPALQPAAASPPGADPAPAFESPMVFVAEPTDDVAEDIEMGLPKLRGYLGQAGIRFAPRPGGAANIEDYRTALRESMQRSAVFVQMLSHLAGRELPVSNGISPRLAAIQMEMARELSIPRLFWRWPKADLTRESEPAHFELLHGRGLHEGEEFHTGTLEHFGKAIVDRIRAVLAPPAVTPAAGSPSERIVVQRFEGDDAIARQIQSALQTLGLQCNVPVPTGDYEKDQAEYERMLRLCEVLLIVYGDPPKDWLPDWLREVYAARAERERNFSGCAVYDGPPHSKPTLNRESLRKVAVINARGAPNGFDRDRLVDFLASVGLP